MDLVPGDVLNEAGEVIGSHKGALVYTNGQRHGFTLHTANTRREALFVIAKNLKENTITVGEKNILSSGNVSITLDSLNVRSTLAVGEAIELQFRYRQTPLQAEIQELGSEKMTLKLTEETANPASGQSCVLYRGSLCIGGGTIE